MEFNESQINPIKKMSVSVHTKREKLLGNANKQTSMWYREKFLEQKNKLKNY